MYNNGPKASRKLLKNNSTRPAESKVISSTLSVTESANLNKKISA